MKIGIFTAMEKEAKSFLQKADVKQIEDGPYKVYSFTLAGKQAYLCSAPNIGEICAAGAIWRLLLKYGVDVVINFGVVGALTEKASLESFVYVESVVHYDMDSSSIDNIPVGRYLCFDDVALPADQTLLQKAKAIKNFPAVRCASADKFVSDPVAKQSLHSNFGAEICDMESAAIAISCHFAGVPYLMVKCISDSLFGGPQEYCSTVMKATEGFFAVAEQLAETLD